MLEKIFFIESPENDGVYPTKAAREWFTGLAPTIKASLGDPIDPEKVRTITSEAVYDEVAANTLARGLGLRVPLESNLFSGQAEASVAAIHFLQEQAPNLSAAIVITTQELIRELLVYYADGPLPLGEGKAWEIDLPQSAKPLA